MEKNEIDDLARLPVVPPTEKTVRDSDGLHKRRGYWYYTLTINGTRRFFSTRTTSYQKARKMRNEAIQQQEEGRLPTDLAKQPFERLASDWLAGREGVVAPQTRRIERERLKPLLEAFRGRRACTISGSDIHGYQMARAKVVSNRTVNLETKVLRMILRYAHIWSRISDDYRSLPESRGGPGRALTPEEEKRLFDTACSSPLWSAAYLAGVAATNTTMRGCELKGLRLGDVDLEKGCVYIRRAATKTDSGARAIPLNSTSAWAFARLIERAQLLGARDSEHFLFPAFLHRKTRGSEEIRALGYDPVQHQKTWRTAWRTLTRAAGLKGLRFHDLRHHAITRLAEAGVPEQTLMAIAGHVSREMLEHYSHIRMEAKRQAVAAIESYNPEKPAVDVTRVN
jgi:integrase